MSEIPPKVRAIYFKGVVAAMIRQIDHLQRELESAEAELQRAQEEGGTTTTCRQN